MPSIFPDGMAGVYDKLGWIVQGHNRYWSANTDYAKQNGGKWEFLVDDASQYALPLEQGFWDWLMMESRKWGLAIYEQDCKSSDGWWEQRQTRQTRQRRYRLY